MKRKSKDRVANPPPQPVAASSGEPQRFRIGAVLMLAFWVGLGSSFYRKPYHEPLWPVLAMLLNIPFGFTPAAMLRYALLFVELCWLIFLGIGIGSAIADRAGLVFEGTSEWLGFSLAIGWGSLGTILALAALLHLWYAHGVYVVLGLLTILLIWKFPARHVVAHRQPAVLLPMDRIIIAILMILAAANFCGAMMPETLYDALVYHLAFPELYWHTHGMIATSYNLYSGFPMLTEMLYGLAIPLGGDRLAHLISFAFGLLTAGMALALCRRFFSLRAGLLAALIFYTTPAVCELAWKSTVELCWSAFQLSAIYAAAIAATDSPNRNRWLGVSAILTGFTIGTKYPAWPFAGVIILIVAWILLREKGTRQDNFWELAMFLVGTVFIGGIWPLKNSLFYHNPIFPFYQDKIAPLIAQPDWRAAASDSHARHLASLASPQGLWNLLIHPWTDLALSYGTMDTMGPLVALGLPLLLFLDCSAKTTRLLGVCLAGTWFAWFASTTTPRYFIPILPLATVLFAAGFERLPKVPRWIGYSFLLFAVTANFLSTVDWFNGQDALPVVLGQETDAHYLDTPHASYPRPSHPAAEFIREHLPGSAKILLHGDARGYGIDRLFVASTIYDESVLYKYIRESKTSEEIRDRLVADGFTHIMVNQAELDVYPPKLLDTSSMQRYRAFVRYLRPVFQIHGDPSPQSGQASCIVLEILKS